MPRMPRRDFETSFFHIMVQGINKEYILNKNIYKEKYLRDLFRYESECNVQILSYCIMDNHAHLLLYAEKIKEMSQFMHLVNFSYASYYNKVNERVGHVFRNRYKSEPIYKERYLLTCINYIHMNPVKAKMVNNPEFYKYSSCRQYMNNTGIARNRTLYETLGIKDYKEVFSSMNNTQQFMDIDNNSEEKLEYLIEEYKKDKNVSIEVILKNKGLLKELIDLLHDRNHIKYKDIAKKLGVGKTTFIKKKK